jgi:hypothetical protein
MVAGAAIAILLLTGYFFFKRNMTVYNWQGKAVVVHDVPGSPGEPIVWVNTAVFPPDEPMLLNLAETMTPAYPPCAHDDLSIQRGTEDRTCSIIAIHHDGSMQFFHFVERSYPGAPDVLGTPDNIMYAAKIPDMVSWRIGKQYVFDSRREFGGKNSSPSPKPDGFEPFYSSALLDALPLDLEEARRKFPPSISVTKNDDDVEVTIIGRLVTDKRSGRISDDLPTYAAVVCSKKRMKCVQAVTFVPRPENEMSATRVVNGILERAPIRANPASQMAAAGSRTTDYSISSWSDIPAGPAIEATFVDVDKSCGHVNLSIDGATRSVQEMEKQTCYPNPGEDHSFMLKNDTDPSDESILAFPILDDHWVSEPRTYCDGQFAYGADHIDEARIFATVAEDKALVVAAPGWQGFWQEFANKESMHKRLDNAAGRKYTAQAYVVARESRVVFVRTNLDDENHDFFRQVEYCFRNDGSIAESSSESTRLPMNEREVRQIFYSESGAVIGTTVQYFALADGAAVALEKRPESFPLEKFPIYRKVSDLPFLKSNANPLR